MPASDWRRFDHRAFIVRRVISGDSFEIDGSKVRLLGVQGPALVDPSTGKPAHGSESSLKYLAARLSDKTVTLRLDNLQTRDSDDELLAYVYLTDVDCINADAVKDGMVYADRRSAHAFHTQYEQAENDARKKQRGLWKGLTEDQMPAWRRSWLHSLVRDRLN